MLAFSPMHRPLALSIVLVACATTAPPAPPEALPLEPPPQPLAATQVDQVSASQVEPTPTPEPLPAAEPPPDTYRIERDGHIVSVTKRDQPCPFAEYSTEWKGLRLRSDHAACQPHRLAESAPLAAELFQALKKELGEAFDPQSFGMNDYPELYQRLAIAAKSEPGWNLATGKPKKGTLHEFVLGTAKDASAFYPELVALFAPLQRVPELSNVEQVLVGKVSATPFADALREAGLKDNDQVPYGSIVWFRLNEP